MAHVPQDSVNVLTEVFGPDREAITLSKILDVSVFHENFLTFILIIITLGLLL